MEHSTGVKNYYENNTRKFLRFHRDAATKSIHQPLWKEADFTPYMRNNTWKHKWIRLLVFAFRWLYYLLPQKSPYFRSWIGGRGKQYCLQKEIVLYKKLVLEKVN